MTELLSFLTQKPDVANAVAAIASATMALVAFIISVVSLYVAHTTLKHQRNHNVLSVRPLPMVTVGDYENRIVVKLRNNGIGPLIIGSLQVRKGSSTKDALIDWMPELPIGLDWVTFVGPLTKRSIPSSGEFTLAELAGDEHSTLFVAARDAVRATLASLIVVVEYTDMYGTQFEPYEKDLEWFARRK